MAAGPKEMVMIEGVLARSTRSYFTSSVLSGAWSSAFDKTPSMSGNQNQREGNPDRSFEAPPASLKIQVFPNCNGVIYLGNRVFDRLTKFCRGH